MALRLITYDLNKEKQQRGDYAGILTYIKAHKEWQRLSESSYVIETDNSTATIFAAVKPYLDENDHLLVVTLASPFSGRHSSTVIDWLSARIQAS